MTALQPVPPGTVASLLEVIGGGSFRDGGGAVTVDVPAARLEAAVHHLAAAGARLADLFAADGEEVTLRLVWGLDTERQYLITETTIDTGEYPPLSDITPAAFVEECEIYEQFGVRPAGGKPLNRVALPPPADRMSGVAWAGNLRRPRCPGSGTGLRTRRKTCTPRTRSAVRPSSSRSARSARPGWNRCITAW